MLYKEDWDKTKSRLQALWENEIIDRCCIAVATPKDGSRYIEQAPPGGGKELYEYYTDPGSVLARNIERFENTYFGGEALPCIFPNFGTAGHAAYVKNCNYKFAPETIWFFPSICDWEKDSMEFDPQSEMLLAEKRLMKALSEEGKGRFFVSMPDNCGSLDALSHLRGSDSLMIDMVENPQQVKDALKIAVSIFKDTGSELFGIIRDNNDGGSVHGWMNTWSGGRHAQLQCDLSVMIPPRMYEEFVLPELEETAGWLDHAIYHLDGREQIRHLDMILSVKGIDMIQWTPVEGQPCTSDFIDILKRIQKAGKGLVLFPEPREINKLMDGLSPKGLIMIARNIESETDARELIKKVEKLSVNHI